LSELCQNVRISGGGFKPPNPPPRYATDTHQDTNHSLEIFIQVYLYIVVLQMTENLSF
jgi:hypothetical protein